MTILFEPIVEQIADNQYRVIAGQMRVYAASVHGYPLIVETRERVEIRLTQYDYNAATRILTNLGAGIVIPI